MRNCPKMTFGVAISKLGCIENYRMGPQQDTASPISSEQCDTAIESFV